MRGRLDALLTLARVAPLTRSIGLVPTVTTTHTEPFHVSKNVATLDYVSLGRAGWKVAVSTTEGEAAHFGRKDAAPPAELYAEAEEAVDVVVRLWDSWEDDAVIRDQPTGRYVDRDKLHYVDFEGRFFDVRGPSITPRPPQGHPIVAVDAGNDLALPIAGSFADLVFVDALDAESASRRRREIHRAARWPPDAIPTTSPSWPTSMSCSSATATPRATRARLDASVGETDASGASGALDFVGTPPELAALLEAWFREEAVDGFTIRPAVLPHTLALLVDDVAPILRERARVPPRVRRRHAARPLRPHPSAESLRGDGMTKQIHLAAHFPGVNSTTVWSDPHLGQPDRLLVVRAPRPDGRARASSTSSSWPRACGSASTAAASSISTSSAGPTRSPCWPRSRPSPTGSASRPR